MQKTHLIIKVDDLNTESKGCKTILSLAKERREYKGGMRKTKINTEEKLIKQKKFLFQPLSSVK